MQEFPTIRYHRTEAPDGVLIPSAEKLAELGAGWVDTPAAFDPNYVPPPPVAKRESPSAAVARRAGYRPQEFPAIRYNRLGEDRIVRSAAQLAELDPAEWRDSPAAFGDAPPVAPVKAAPAVAETPSTPPTADQDDAERKAADAMAEQARTLHAMPVDEVKAKLAGAPAEVLTQAKQLEMLKPDGPRVSLVKFIDAALKALADGGA